MTLATAILCDLHANTEALSRPTRCFAIMGTVRKALSASGCELGESHGSYDGIVTHFTDADGRRYSAIITPE